MTIHRPSTSDHGSRDSIRRDAWRIQLFHEQVAEEAAARRRAADLRWAVILGVALGVAGSVSMYL